MYLCSHTHSLTHTHSQCRCTPQYQSNNQLPTTPRPRPPHRTNTVTGVAPTTPESWAPVSNPLVQGTSSSLSSLQWGEGCTYSSNLWPPFRSVLEGIRETRCPVGHFTNQDTLFCVMILYLFFSFPFSHSPIPEPAGHGPHAGHVPPEPGAVP